MKTLILICALSVSQPDCSTETAVSVVQGPEAAHLARCGFVAQAYLADTAIANYLDGEHYLKILCAADNRLETTEAPRESDGAHALAITP